MQKAYTELSALMQEPERKGGPPSAEQKQKVIELVGTLEASIA